jgi:long-chain fatty acid transport protein
MNSSVSHFLSTFGLILTLGSPTAAQSFESVGERALGMGGAFVAVANDSSAAWWNPAGLATGPFLDLSVGKGSATADADLPASRTGVWSFSLSTPPLGVSYYRLKITEMRAGPATGPAEAGREDRAAGEGLRSLSISQFGATVLHTITTGVTARVRGFDPIDASAGIPELLDAGDDLDGGEVDATLDVDVGLLATRGAVRVGVTARNLRAPRFGGRKLPRQVRAGAAFDGATAGTVPVLLSVDADLGRYDGVGGDRRVIAVGVEHWLRPLRFAIRGGARFNTAGEQDRTVTAGASVAARAGLFIDGYAAAGGPGGHGWGIAARVSF